MVPLFRRAAVARGHRSIDELLQVRLPYLCEGKLADRGIDVCGDHACILLRGVVFDGGAAQFQPAAAHLGDGDLVRRGSKLAGMGCLHEP